MGCGSNSGALPVGDMRTVVYGDIFNTDTRNVLTILEMTEVPYVFKETQRGKIEQSLGDDSASFSVDTISKSVPVLEDLGFKRIGSGHEIVEYVCSKDQRNAIKRDEKGKPIKPKKGVPPAKSLAPKELDSEIQK
jgi:hypothetical protein